MRLLCAAAFALTLLSPAGADEDPSWEIWETRQLMLAEMERARALGGYNDPFTAAQNLARGEASEKDLTNGYSDWHDLPENRGTARGEQRR